MSFPDRYSYHFYPVGQGLFSAGSICRHGEGKSRFLWVYDCGTSSSQKLLDNGIDQLNFSVGDRKRIDLLVLSHFDHDHISGVVRLLKKFRIGTLLLPYMQLSQRLIIAFEKDSGGANDPMTDFYLNPVAFLLAQDGMGIDRILFVPPSGNEGPAYPGQAQNSRELGPEDEPKIDFNKDNSKDTDDARSMVQAGQKRNAAVEFLHTGSRITFAAHWEFIPYNDDPQTVITDEFVKEVDAERASLLTEGDGTRRDESLKRLKKAYDKHFGAGSEERNSISLFLYSGPIYSSCSTCWLMEGRSMYWPTRIRHWHRCPFSDMRTWELRERHEEPCSILYSGDGYLDTNDRLQKLITYLNMDRVARIGIFQVMHHGAEANWHQGVAAAISPLFSVFSSDPERKKWKHPHAPVLRDFWRYGSVQVDKNTDFTVYGYLRK